ncbi:EAL domain-containing protein [Uliginosibacterium sp. 31-16]|uniref:EAL domain-containing protein n=1 Tax=Uliginosibacterium sp. 31-16 TaxID=3068315 RepID=UPI00273F24A9|nr:EAL domain-containing protein [Uliginosibacterium sp. 31-16]MDP5240396.1 EAL domain-containing protein [Uliginosibacterium sp. 31-16]
MNRPASTSPIQVLLIDADPPLYDTISAVLHASGEAFNLTPLNQLGELEQALEHADADCLLCAQHPNLSIASEDSGPAGLMLLQRVRRHPGSLPVIMLCCAEELVGFAAQAMWQGAADCLCDEALLRLPAAIRIAVQYHATMASYQAPDNELQLALAVLRGSRDGICVTDAAGNILLVNDTFTQMSGYTLAEVKGHNPRILKSGQQDPEYYLAMWQAIVENGCWQGEIINRHKDGSTYTEWLRISSVLDEAGQPSHYVGQFGYVAEQKRLVDRINQLTQFDPLTGLPNRSLFLDRMEQSLVASRRSGRCSAAILVNLDRFRLINDTLSQATGDRVLVDMARRFAKQIRQGDTVARLSGNEFCFLLSNLNAAEDAILLAQRLQDVIARPLEHDNHPLIVTASIGISVAPRDGEDGETLLKAADAALIRAKLEGGNCVSFYSPSMDADARRRQAIEAQLRGALARNELSVVYQAQNNLDSGNIIGTEALLRWHNAELGMVSPGEFIPVAEETGLIIPIGSWVMRQACAQNKEWLDQGLGRMRVAVNLSTRQFRGDTLVDEVAAVLAETGLPAELLELEVTESALINNIDAAVATCRKLKALGVKLSLDDFGTGYSSLAYVARFPFDKLKIDQGFVSDITHNPANAAIATAAIAIAHGLNLSVLAEGVETEAQAIFLRNRRCDAMQGYLFSRPAAPDAIAQLLAQKARLHLGATATAASKQTLLIVDDEPAILNAMHRLFRHENYNIITAQNGNDAFELLARTPAQVIISDQRMAGMTGTEFFTRVRQLYPDSLRIILSGYTELEAVMDAVNHGAVYKFLTKPWEDDQLREQVREAFRIAGRQGDSGAES